MPPEEPIAFGAAALPEPERNWLAAVERLPIDSVWQGGHVLPPGPSGEAITRLALHDGLDRAGPGRHRHPAPAALPPGRGGQAAPRPRRPLGRAGLGRSRGRRGVRPGVRRRRRAARRAWRADRRGHRGPAGALVAAGRSATTAVSSTSTTSGLRPVGASGSRPARAGPAARRSSCPGASSRPCAAPPDSATAGCPTCSRRTRTAVGAGDSRRGARRPGGTSSASSGCCTSTRRSAATATGPATRSPPSSAGAYGDQTGAMLDRIAPAGHARRRWRRGCRSTSTRACATS